MACCSELLRLLADYLEGRLSPERHRELDEHLAGCCRCVQYLQTYRSTVSLLGTLTEDDLPPELRSRLRIFIDGHARN
jgi:anti-sigma factor RsiW